MYMLRENIVKSHTTGATKMKMRYDGSLKSHINYII